MHAGLFGTLIAALAQLSNTLTPRVPAIPGLEAVLTRSFARVCVGRHWLELRRTPYNTVKFTMSGKDCSHLLVQVSAVLVFVESSHPLFPSLHPFPHRRPPPLPFHPVPHVLRVTCVRHSLSAMAPALWPRR